MTTQQHPDSDIFISELAKSPQAKRLFAELKLPKLSVSSNSMLDVWFKKIRNSFREYDLKKDDILKTLKKETILNKVREFNIIPQSLTKVIDRVCVNNYSFSISFPPGSTKGRVFKTYICAPIHFTETKIRNMIRLISTWFLFVNDFVDNGCSNTVDIFLYLIPDKKSLPEHDDAVIDREHVNTAFTTSCDIKTNVHIYREEEWFRALIHESFHNLGLDFIRMGDTPIQAEEKRINAAFHTNVPDIRLYETYCEMWAEVLNVLFYVHVKTPPSEIRRWKSEFFRLLQYEQAFAVFQCVKLLKHNKISYDTLDQQGYLFKEKTNSFSYYILKCILSVHLDQFFYFCSTQFGDDEDQYTLQFRKSITNLKKYTSMIIRNRKSLKMKATTKMMENAGITHAGLQKSLRMSLFEIAC
jgi:hypothetical protein